jgi:hypothetical protein
MKSITKPISRGVIEIRVLKQTSAIYFFKVGIPDLGMAKIKCQNIGQNKTNSNTYKLFRGMYNCCKH